MPVPLLWLGASALTLLAGTKYANDKVLEQSVGIMPGQGGENVRPTNGAIVTCGVYGVFEHTGIWLDGHIIELKGNGLIRSISPERFVSERSGEHIYIACDNNNHPLVSVGAAQRAASQLFTYSKYDVVNNNCHRFVWNCICSENISLTRFSALNQKMATLFDCTTHWQPIIPN